MRRRPPTAANAASFQDRKALRRIQKADRRQERSAFRATRATIDLITALGRSLFAPTPPDPPRGPATGPSSSARRGGLRQATGVRASTAGPAPMPRSARPGDARGRVTIHFHTERLTKGSPTGTASGHQSYIERENATDRLTEAEQTADPDAARARLAGAAADHQGYAEREGATDRLDDAARYWRPDANMPLELKDGIALIGNIGETPAQRRHWWDAVDAYESIPGPGHLRIYLRPQDWAALTERPDFPAVLHQARLSKMPRRRSMPNADADEGDVTPKIRPDGTQLRRLSRKLPGVDEAEAWLRARLPEVADRDDLIQHEPGRGGTVQYRMIIELPHELTSAQRLDLVWDFTQVFRDRGLPYSGAIHRPDPKKNNPLNWHAHVDHYDRPCVRDPKTGLWDIETQKIGPNRHPTFQHIPNKDRAINHRDWIPALRQHLVQVTNRHLAAAGLPKRYSAETYADMGILKKPGEHHGPAKAAVMLKSSPGAEATAVEKLRTELMAKTEPYREEILDRYLVQLRNIGYRTDRSPDHPAAKVRVDEFIDLARRQTDRARQRKLHQQAMARAKGKLAAEQRRLEGEIAAKELLKTQDPTAIRAAENFDRRIATLRQRLADVETQRTALDLIGAEVWAQHEADTNGPGRLERKRMAVLLKQLDRIRNATLDPSVAENAQRAYGQKAMDDSIAAQRAREPAAPPPRVRPAINVYTPRAPEPPPVAVGPTPPASPAPPVAEHPQTPAPASAPAPTPTQAPARPAPRAPVRRPPTAT